MLKRLVAVLLITGCLVGIIAFTGCGHSSNPTPTPTPTPTHISTSTPIPTPTYTATPTPTPTSTHTPTPTPTPIPTPTPESTHTLIISSSSGGTTGPVPGTYTFSGSQGQVTIYSLPNPGYQFVGWEGDNNTITYVRSYCNDDGTELVTYSIAMNGNYSITAEYTPNEYHLTLAANPPAGGTQYFDGNPSTPFAEGAVVSIHANPNSGWIFQYWAGSGGIISNSSAQDTTITMHGGCVLRDFSLQAVYEQLPVITSVVANPSVVSLGNESFITCTAVGYNGRALTYHWGFYRTSTSCPTSNGCNCVELGVGNFSGSGNVIDWIPSVTGEFTIWVEVTDEGWTGFEPGGHYSCASTNVWCK
jgi:uncharacterized repeat protein (TIGR02543 family)